MMKRAFTDTLRSKSVEAPRMSVHSPVILSEAGWVGVKRKNLKMRNTGHRPCFS